MNVEFASVAKPSRAVAKLAAKLDTYTIRPFDYGDLDPVLIETTRSAAERIRQHQKNAAIEIGRELLVVKASLDHGLFLKWVEAECGFTRRTATNLMNTAAEFAGKWEIVSHLPSSIIYQLAAPSTPPAVREAVLQRSEDGRQASPNSVRRLIKDAKKPTPHRRTQEELAAARESQQRDADEMWRKRQERDEAKRKARVGEAGELARRAAAMVEDALGPDYDRFRHLVAKLNRDHREHMSFLVDAFLAPPKFAADTSSP